MLSVAFCIIMLYSSIQARSGPDQPGGGSTNLTACPQCFCNIFPFFFSKSNPTVLVIHSQTFIKITDVLCQHLERFPKCTPCTACYGVGMAHSIHVRSRFMDFRVDEKPCRIRWSRLTMKLVVEVHVFKPLPKITKGI